MSESQQELLLKIRGDVHEATEAIASLRGEFHGLGSVLAGLTSPLGILTTGLGLMVAAATESVNAFLEEAKAVREFAFQSGLAAEEAHTLLDSMKIMGVEEGAMRTAMMRLSIEIQNGAKHLQAMGISLRDNEGNMKTQGELFLEARDKLSEMGSAQERAANMVKLFGRGSAELIPIMNMTKEEFKALQQKAEEFGAKLDELSLQKAKEFQIQINLMKDRAHEFSVTIGTYVLPVLTKMFEIMDKVISGQAMMIGSAGNMDKMAAAIKKNMDAEMAGIKQSLEASKVLIDAKKRESEAVLAINEALNKEILKKDQDTLDGKLQLVDWWVADEKKKVLALYAFTSEAQVQSLAKSNKDAAAALATLTKLYEAAAAQRLKIMTDEEKKEADSDQKQIDLGTKIRDAAYKKWATDFAALQAKLKDLEAKGVAERIALDKKEWDEKVKIADESMKFIMSSALAKHKELYLIARAAAIGEAIMDTYMAANKALAAFPPPYNFVVAALVTAAGLANVAEIVSAPKPMAMGGIVTRPTYAMIGEAGPEAVIPLDQAGGAGGMGTTIIINVGTILATRQQANELAKVVGDALMSRLRSNRSI